MVVVEVGGRDGGGGCWVGGSGVEVVEVMGVAAQQVLRCRV